MRQVSGKIVLIGIVQFIICNMVYDLTGIDRVWFTSMALCFFLVSYAYHLINNSFASQVLMFFTFNQLWEELFNDPLITSFAEYLGALIFLILFSINHFLKQYERNNNGISD